MASAVVTYDRFLYKKAPVLRDDKVNMGMNKVVLRLHIFKQRGERQPITEWFDGLLPPEVFDQCEYVSTALAAKGLLFQFKTSASDLNDEDTTFVPVIVEEIPKGSAIVSFLDNVSPEPTWEDEERGPEYIKVPPTRAELENNPEAPPRTWLAVFPSVKEAVAVLEKHHERSPDGSYGKAKIFPWDAFGNVQTVCMTGPILLPLPWGPEVELEAAAAE